MRTLTITMMSVTVGLALILSFMLGQMSVPVAMNDVISVQEVTPEEVHQATPAVTVHEKTFAMRIFSWFGKSPGDTITSIEPSTIDGTSAKMGGFRSLKQAVKGPLVILAVGVILAVAGLACFIWLDRIKGIIVMVGGGVLILAGVMFESYPWLALVLPLLGIGFVVWWLLATKKGKAILEDLGLKHKALVQVVAGVQAVKDTTAKTEADRMAINTTLKAEQDSDVQALVREIKNGG